MKEHIPQPVKDNFNTLKNMAYTSPQASAGMAGTTLAGGLMLYWRMASGTPSIQATPNTPTSPSESEFQQQSTDTPKPYFN